MVTTELSISTDRTKKFIADLEAQKTLLTTCTRLFTNLSSHFTSLQNSLNQRSQTLESKLQTLESTSRQTLESLSTRESSIPELESNAVIKIDEQRESAIAEFKITENNLSSTLSDDLKSLCRKMDSSGLLKFIVSRRKESVTLRAEIASAIAEAIDAPRLLLDAVEEYVTQRIERIGGVTDKRWACGMLVQALFPETVKRKEGPEFAWSLIERAVEIAERWKRVFDPDFEGGTMGPSEAVMFLQVVTGFGLSSKFDEKFVRRLVVQFAARRDMAKLATGLGFGEKLGDIVDELVKGGKEIEAIYFAYESGLTDRFPPISLLKSYLRNSKKNATNILKNGKYGATATEESNNMEYNSINAVIKCVEDHKLESEFALDSLKKRAAHLEKTKAEKKKTSASIKSQKKRGSRGRGGRGENSSGPPPFRPNKVAKFSNTGFPPYSRRNPAPPPPVSPAARYSGPVPYTYPSQSVIYEAQPTTQQYATYSMPPPAQSSPTVPQHHYAHPGEISAATQYHAGPVTYGAAQTSYGSYDYGSAPPSTSYPAS